MSGRSKKLIFAVVAVLVVILAGPALYREFLKPSVLRWARTFPESKTVRASVDGSYAGIACHNSHRNWGETTRRTLLLDGMWDVAKGESSDRVPDVFEHSAPVPGLVTDIVPPIAAVADSPGSEAGQAYWYRRSFRAPDSPSAVSVLCLEKARYGVKVWLNGQAVGQHFGASSLSEYNLSPAIRYGQENTVVVRVGAGFTQVPEFVPVGADPEIFGWFAGIWDSVSVVFTGPYTIVRSKVESDIDRSEVTIHTTVRNNSADQARLTLSQSILEWNSRDPVTGVELNTFTLGAGETTTVSQTLTLQDPRWWSPEKPYLYAADSVVSHDGTDSDDRLTRFGFREVEWRSAPDRGFFLNHQRYFLRGTNIALHRFFDDQDRKQLPWNEQWVRELLRGMKPLHWNSFRFHIGRAPNFWYDLADEIGFIVDDEFQLFAPIRFSTPGTPGSNNWSQVEMAKEFTAWVQENWNHPSIGWWSASNETHNPMPYALVPEIRVLDPTRAWESGSYRAPDLPDDPLEEHPYRLNGMGFLNSNPRDYTLADLDTFDRQPPQTSGTVFRTYDGEGAREHAYINNEFGWLWLTRDGSDPTPITAKTYRLLAGDQPLTVEERREIYAYVVSELAGYWRAGRGYAGVQHFLYLGKCTDKDTVPPDWPVQEPSPTCDNFIDLAKLMLEPRWRQWGAQAFSPLAINIDRWDEKFYVRGFKLRVPVTLVNDLPESHDYVVSLLAADARGRVLSRSTAVNGKIEALGRVQLEATIPIPEESFVLYARLESPGLDHPVFSRRKVGFAHPGVLTGLPDEIAASLN